MDVAILGVLIVQRAALRRAIQTWRQTAGVRRGEEQACPIQRRDLDELAAIESIAAVAVPHGAAERATARTRLRLADEAVHTTVTVDIDHHRLDRRPLVAPVEAQAPSEVER